MILYKNPIKKITQHSSSDLNNLVIFFLYIEI